MSIMEAPTPTEMSQQPSLAKHELGSDAQTAGRVEGKDMSTEESTANNLGLAHARIATKLKEGFFTDEGQKELADKAVTYQGEVVNPQTSESLKAMLDVLSSTQDPLYREISQYVQIKLDGSLVSLEDWQKKLKAVTPEEAKVLEGKGLYGFVFPKEDQPTQPESTLPKESQKDQTIDKYRQMLEAQMKLAKVKGESLLPEQAELLVTLRLVQETEKGEISALFKEDAYEDIKEVLKDPQFDLEEALKNLEEPMRQANEKLHDCLVKSGWTEEQYANFRNAIGEGKAVEMIKEGKFPLKVEGLGELMFGEKLTEEKLKELQKLVDIGKKKGLLEALLIILVSLVSSGPTEFAKEAVGAK